MTMADQDFNQLWAALIGPVKALDKRITSMSRQSARAEVAGAVEVVAALPSAGQAGRVVMLDSDKTLYYDDGTTWKTIGGGRVAASAFTNNYYTTSSTSFVNVDATNLKITLTPTGTTIAVIGYAQTQANNVTYNVGAIEVYGDNGAGSSSPSWVAQNGAEALTVFKVYTGLTPGQTYTFYLRYKTGVAGGVAAISGYNNGSGLMGWEV